jgi:predicted nucleic acid-binding protein
MDNIEIYSVGYLYMKSYGLNEIYSFDKHLDLLKDITRIPEKSEN